MKKFTFVFALILSICFLTSCHSVRPKAGEEAVLTYTPWFFGHGGVDMEAVPTGLTWCVFTTSATYFPIVPVKNQVDMDDLFSDDNTPLDFHTVIRTQIIQGKSPIGRRRLSDLSEPNSQLYLARAGRVRHHYRKAGTHARTDRRVQHGGPRLRSPSRSGR